MDTTANNPSVFHQLSNSSQSFLSGKVLILLFVVMVLGIGGGYMLSHQKLSMSTSNTIGGGTSGKLQTNAIYGSADTSTFKDTTTGVMQKGGIDGEGQYHLVRPGGDSQNVYLTSSIVDLSQFIGHKVQVWGQTQAAQHAGWLMDVGRVEVMQ